MDEMCGSAGINLRFTLLLLLLLLLLFLRLTQLLDAYVPSQRTLYVHRRFPRTLVRAVGDIDLPAVARRRRRRSKKRHVSLTC